MIYIYIYTYIFRAHFGLAARPRPSDRLAAWLPPPLAHPPTCPLLHCIISCNIIPYNIV